MTDYSVTPPNTTFSQTLTASTADTVTFTDQRARYASITNTGSAVLYARADGQAAAIGGEGCIAVLPGTEAVIANGLPMWFPSSNVIPQGVNQFGGGNTSSSPSSPGMVQSQRSLAGGVSNPGTVISLISTAADTYTVALAG